MVAAAAGSSGRLFDGSAATLRSAAARRQPRARQRGSVAVARDASGSATDGLARALSAPAWSAGEERRPLVLTFHWIVDDIVSHTGETAMCCPGGGDDFPEAHRQYVDILGASLNLLALPGKQTPRAWQLVEADGLRTQVWRSSVADSEAMLALGSDLLPRGLTPDGVHFASSPLASAAGFIRQLKAAGVPLVGHEVYTHNTEPVSADTVAELVTGASYFSPNALEAACLLAAADLTPGQPWQPPPASPAPDLPAAKALAVRLSAAHGRQNVLLRCGPLGALLTGADVPGCPDGAALHVPAYTPSVLDSTGCGNTFAGAFQAGLLASGDCVHALAVAAAAASLMGAHKGVPPLSTSADMDAYMEVGERRTKELAGKVRVV
eukprot:jgi/Tetstr1/424476/TSEL_015005.t1